MYIVKLDGMVLPVTPSAIKVKIGNNNKVVSLIDGGDVNLLKAPGLSEYSFEFILPTLQRYTFARYVGEMLPAEYYLEKLEKLKTGKKPFYLVIVRLSGNTQLFGTDALVSLEDYEIEEDAKEGPDVKVSVNLKEYREYHTKTFVVNQKTATASVSTARSTTTAPGKTSTTYKIASGDTLSKIAKKFYGNAALWTKVYDANKAAIEAAAKKRGKNDSRHGYWIYPGTVLQIPAKGA